jgi:hypothetical protein
MIQFDASHLEAPPSIPAATELEKRLRHSPYWSLRRLVCICQQDRVVLRGTVPSFYLRQVADSLAANVVGLGRVLSEIQVESDLSEASQRGEPPNGISFIE